MKVGTTPTHAFCLPFTVDMVSAVEIAYVQSGTTKLTKVKDDCTLTDRTVSVTLTQEDTFLLTEGVPVEIQLRVLTTGGDVLMSEIYSVSCDRCLFDEVLA